MAGKMLIAAETLGLFGEHRDRKEVAAERIARRAINAIRSGHKDPRPHGGFFGLISSHYDTDVYAQVADLMADEDIEIEVHAFKEIAQVPTGEGAFSLPAEIPERRDRIVAMSVGGEAVEMAQRPEERDNHLERVWPPEAS